MNFNNTLPVMLATLALSLSACSKTTFSTQKAEKLSGTSVFGDEANGNIPQGDDANGNINQPNGGGDAYGGIGQPNGPGGPANGNIGQPNGSGGPANGGLVQPTIPGMGGGTGSGNGSSNGSNMPGGMNPYIPGLPGNTGSAPLMGDTSKPAYLVTPGQSTEKVWLYCSDENVNIQGRSNFKKAYNLNEPIQLAVNGYLCSTDKVAIRALITQDTFSLDQLRALCPSVVPSHGLVRPEVYVNNRTLTYYQPNYSRLEVHWAANNNPTAGDQKDQFCDRVESPLVVHLTSNVNDPKPITLTDKARGIFFDLLGALNNYVPVRISWFTNDDYAFITLPDRDGEVKGIDQLFGSRTLGPDGRFAENGYEALAKYDDNNDGFITRDDRVFHRLRLWTDYNKNGHSEPDELRTLNSYRIQFIDLNYSTDYAETDNWGNETKMKSVIGYEDGSLDLLFDLWFAYRLSY